MHRCYDLNQDNEVYGFIEDYMVCAANAVLLRFLKDSSDMKGADGKWLLLDCERTRLVQLAVKV